MKALTNDQLCRKLVGVSYTDNEITLEMFHKKAELLGWVYDDIAEGWVQWEIEKPKVNPIVHAARSGWRQAINSSNLQALYSQEEINEMLKDMVYESKK